MRKALNNHEWNRTFEWRDVVTTPLADARNLGAIEFNQRHVSFRMKKRGMQWVSKGSKTMVKVKQGVLNNTLWSVYFKD